MWHSLRYWPDIDNPKTFNEKIAHRKLKEHDDRFCVLADKYTVRDYVRAKIGEKYLSNVYKVISSISELNFEDLPKCFVAKPTNQSRKLYFVDNTSQLHKENFLGLIDDWLHSKFDYGIFNGEYWYADMPSRVMFEERLTDGKHDVPMDFKFHVFHGKVQAIQVDFDRFTHHKMNFYTREWQQIPLRKGKCPNKLVDPEEVRPSKLDEMVSIAETLARDFDYVRVDLYYLSNSGRIVFGEMTFAPGSGYSPFIPNCYDLEFGKMW